MIFESALALGILLFSCSAGSAQAIPPGNAQTRSNPSDVLRDYQVGPDDLLVIAVLEAADLGSSARVSAAGQISLPLIGVLTVSDLTLRQIEVVVAEKLRAYIKDPHVNVQVSEMRSRPVSLVGAVRKPGVFQLSGPKSLLEILSLGEGLAEDAGDTIVLMRRPSVPHGSANPAAAQPANSSGKTEGPQERASSQEIRIHDLLESRDPQFNVPVYPGDVVKVKQAGMVYSVGDVNKPGGYIIRNNQKLTVLQAIALSEGLRPTAAKDSSVIIRTDEHGNRSEIPIELGKILKGKQSDVTLQARDVLFVPNSASKTWARGALDSMVRVLTLRPIP